MSEPAWCLSLPALRGECWRRLENREGAAAQPALATPGPEVRTVVLRGADRAAATLEVHTDLASPKIAALQKDPTAAFLIWDADAALQIRIRAEVEVISGEAARSAWEAVPPPARTRYGGSRPGAALPLPEAAEDEADPARFAVLRAHVRELEALHLGELHRRALYQSRDGFAGGWIAP